VTNLAVAEAYYEAVNNKDIASVAEYFHPEIQFTSPMAQLSGRDAALEAVRRLLTILKGVHVRAKFSSGDQVMMAYDFEFPDPIGVSRTAALMTFADGLISRLELFFDARPFQQK
jgi:hypothetical protein